MEMTEDEIKFFEYIRKGDFDLAKVLLECGEDINSRYREGITPLMLAAYEGDINAVKFLVENGADIHIENNEGLTVFHIALATSQAKIVEYLSKKIILSMESHPTTPLLKAIATKNINSINNILDTGLDINSRATLEAPNALSAAIIKGDLDIISLLLKRGALITEQHKHEASTVDNPEILKILETYQNQTS